MSDSGELTRTQVELVKNERRSERDTALDVRDLCIELAVKNGSLEQAAREVEQLRKIVTDALALVEVWRYKGEDGSWQEGKGPDYEGYILDKAAEELRKVLEQKLS